MTITHILLLTQPADSEILGNILKDHNPSLEIIPVSDRASLDALARTDLSATRLISFCSSVIVPGEMLKALPTPSYNFHPGPPDRPGRFPSVFAVYEKAENFGVTVHEMAARVDAGPIVAAEWFPVPENATVTDLEIRALESLAVLFRRFAPFLALTAGMLPRVFIPWSGTKRSKADCEMICRITPDLTAEDIELRKRACGALLQA